MLTGAFGAILLSSPGSYTVGASGAVFGLMGAGVVFLRARGVDPMASGLGPTILINLAFPFLFPGLNVSIGGHLGGLLGGALAGYAIVTRLSERRSSPVLPVLACVAIGAVGAGRRPTSRRATKVGALEHDLERRARRGSGTRSGCRMCASSSSPSTSRGPGREK